MGRTLSSEAEWLEEVYRRNHAARRRENVRVAKLVGVYLGVGLLMGVGVVLIVLSIAGKLPVTR